MRILPIGILFLSFVAGGAVLPAQSYDGLHADYSVCTGGGANVSNEDIVAACTRLIDNSAKKNELVGFFHAIRASVNNDKSLNCADAKTASTLIKDPKMLGNLRQLMSTNC